LLSAPPVLVAPETVTLASRADATLLVTPAGTGRVSELAEAERLLTAVGASPMGVVVSRPD
jgi:hypothetical protein